MLSLEMILRTRKIKSRQPGCNYRQKYKKFFDPGKKTIENHFLFQKLLSPQTVSLDTWKAVLRNLLNFFGKEAESLCGKMELVKNI